MTDIYERKVAIMDVLVRPLIAHGTLLEVQTKTIELVEVSVRTTELFETKVVIE